MTLDECEYRWVLSATDAYDVDGILSLDMQSPEGELQVVDDGESTSVDGTWNDEPVTSG